MGEALLAVDLIIKLLAQAQTVSAMLKDHQENGTPIDLDALRTADDASRQALDAAIKAARSQP